MTDLALPRGWERWPPHRKLELRDVLRQGKFLSTYRNDRVAFVHDCFEWDKLAEDGPHEYQEWALAQLDESGKGSERGPHGLGKTAIAAWAILHFGLTRDGIDDWKCVCIAYVMRQLREFLWPEVHKWSRLLRWDIIGRDPFTEPEELQDTALRLSTGQAFSAAPTDAAAIEGAHADQLLYIYDEAKAIIADVFDATEGAFSSADPARGREAFALMISTPGEPNGRFYDVHARKPGYEDWRTRHVKVDEAVAAGRIDPDWPERQERRWGRDSAVFQNRVLGEFAASGEQNVIPLAWVERAQERWRELALRDVSGGWRIPDEVMGEFTCVGFDVADQGEDRSVLALRFGDVISELRAFPYDTEVMAATGRCVGVLRAKGGYAVVDSIGVGAGSVGRIREQGHAVRAFNASSKSHATDATGELEFANLRSEAWWGFREILQDDRAALPAEGELADMMIGDLTAPRWKTTSAGKIIIEPKDDIRARLGRSPDVGDAIVMAAWRGGVHESTMVAAPKTRLPEPPRRRGRIVGG